MKPSQGSKKLNFDFVLDRVLLRKELGKRKKKFTH